MKKKLSSNMEDYLEAIALLGEKNSIARVRDISRLLNVKSSSVNAALNTLSKSGLVAHEKYGYVELTQEGEELAHQVKKRHDMLLKFLIEILKINPEIAKSDACKMEHSISPQTLHKITKFIEFVETYLDDDGPDWLKSFDYYFKSGKRRKCKMRDIKQKSKVG